MEIPFDGILSLLVFLVGIPALVLQLISSAERRAIIKREKLDVSKFLRLALIIFFLGLIVQVIILLFPPFEKENFNRLLVQSVWLGVFTGLFILVLYVVKKIPEQYGQREKIIEKLIQDIVNESRSKGRIAGGTFSDLADLGINCEPGQEREMVINAFKHLVHTMLDNPSYKGDSFEELIDELLHILAFTPEPKDLRNYAKAIKILSTILPTKKDLDSDDDKQRALHAISKLGRSLIIHFKSIETDNIILDHLDSLEFALFKRPKMLTEVSQALFEIGICAVNESEDLIAVAALDKMTSLTEDNQPLPDEFVADMLGLLAHFWKKDGSRREFTLQKLNNIKPNLPKNIRISFDEARAHCCKTMYFDTADYLLEMKEQINLIN